MMRDSTSLVTAVDLFCGAGGLTHGLQQGGIDVAAGFDLDKDCRHPYEVNNDAVFHQSDIGELDARQVRELLNGSRFSLLAGCPPCQPFSTYSQSHRKSGGGEGWKLVGEFGRIIESVQPDLVVMENVPQLSRHPVFSDLLSRLNEYHVNWAIVEAVRWGVPQTRKRLVLIASKLSADGLNLISDYQLTKTVRDSIADLPPLRAGEADAEDPLHAASRLSERNLQRIRHSKPGGTWRDWPSSLQSSCHRRDSGATYSSVYGRMSWDEPSPTITTQCFGYGNGRFGHPSQDRAISLREAALLQTFPADYEFVAPGEKVRFGVLGRLIGNAVPVRLGEVIGATIMKHVADYV